MSINVKKYKLSIFIFVILLLFLLIVLIPLNTIFLLPVNLTVTFFINGILILIFLIKEVKFASISLNVVHWIFFLFYFLVTPVINKISNYYQWGFEVEDKQIVEANLLVLIWIIMYVAGGVIAKRKCRKINIFNTENICFKKDILFFLTIISVGCTLYLINIKGLHNMFARSTAGTGFKEYSKTSSLLIGSTLPAIIKLAFVLIFIDTKIYKKKYKLLLLINTMSLLIACFPTALARNATANIYFGILFLFCYSNTRKYRYNKLLLYAFVGGLLIVFPVINVFRRAEFQDADVLGAIQRLFNDFMNTYNSGDYDAYSMIMHTKTYVNNEGISLGYYLLGAIFFFIPRVWWTTKPFGSGQTIFTSFNAPYTNISCPLLAEGYINFGILGVIIFAFVAGYICTTLDVKFWRISKITPIPKNGLTLLYPFLLSSYFFMLRGDLMSSFAYMMAYVVVFLFFIRIYTAKAILKKI